MGETAVVAPDSPQSAAGHSITLVHPLTVQHVQVDGLAGKKFAGISVDGRPADCVRLAIRNLLSAPPELVVSGINAGSNIGINVFYSGTVAAAAEAAMLGIPAIAFSAAMVGEVNFTLAGRLCRWVLDQLLKIGLTGGDLINVNLPSFKAGNPKGIRVVRQSTAGIEDEYVPTENPNGGQSFKLGEKYKYLDGLADTDVAALHEGYITITPLHIDMTNHDRLSGLGKITWQALPK